jgi:hypothetical protein
MSNQLSIVVFSSRRPTHFQVESWIQASGLRRLKRWIEPRGEEGVWLVQSLTRPSPFPFTRDPKRKKR